MDEHFIERQAVGPAAVEQAAADLVALIGLVFLETHTGAHQLPIASQRRQATGLGRGGRLKTQIPDGGAPSVDVRVEELPSMTRVTAASIVDPWPATGGSDSDTLGTEVKTPPRAAAARSASTR